MFVKAGIPWWNERSPEMPGKYRIGIHSRFSFPLFTGGDPGVDHRLYRNMAAGKKDSLEIYVFLDYI
jgi:hypothetical protein